MRVGIGTVGDALRCSGELPEAGDVAEGGDPLPIGQLGLPRQAALAGEPKQRRLLKRACRFADPPCRGQRASAGRDDLRCVPDVAVECTAPGCDLQRAVRGAQEDPGLHRDGSQEQRADGDQPPAQIGRELLEPMKDRFEALGKLLGRVIREVLVELRRFENRAQPFRDLGVRRRGHGRAAGVEPPARLRPP